jgi:hypothetical protein
MTAVTDACVVVCSAQPELVAQLVLQILRNEARKLTLGWVLHTATV